MKRQVIKAEGTTTYPDLDSFLGGYFHQDSSIFGSTLEAVVDAYKKDAKSYVGAVARTRQQLADYLVKHADDANFDAEFERVFMPGVLAEGWETGITNWRQWLIRVSEILATPTPV